MRIIKTEINKVYAGLEKIYRSSEKVTSISKITTYKR